MAQSFDCGDFLGGAAATTDDDASSSSSASAAYTIKSFSAPPTHFKGHTVTGTVATDNHDDDADDDDYYYYYYYYYYYLKNRIQSAMEKAIEATSFVPDSSQRKAISMICAPPHLRTTIALICGPPGTGKTRVAALCFATALKMTVNTKKIQAEIEGGNKKKR